MKHILTLILTMALLLSSMTVTALAETISLDGTVTAGYTIEIYAASTAIVQQVNVQVGQMVSAGDVIATLRTTKVCAEEDGTITAVFGETGDLADVLTTRYGAAIYMETDVLYTVSATTDKAYDAVDTKLVHVGETVWLRSRADETRTGAGIITAVDGSSYTVHVTAGDFIIGETVEICRDVEYTESSCLGRGDVGRNAPLAVTATGRIATMHVKPGDTVKKGDLLMETLEGSGSSAAVKAEVSGVVAELAIQQGTSITENTVAAVIWPSDAMQIEASIPEVDLSYVTIGDEVTLTFDWNADSGETITGTVQDISAISDSESSSTVFTLVVAFTPDENVRYGMNVTISTAE